MRAWVKILLLTVGTLLVLALAVLLIYFASDRTPRYETVDTAYQPVTVTPTPPPTPTPVPTPEPTPTPTPEPVETPEPEPEPDEDGFYPCDDSVTVTTDGLNVRSEPNTSCSVIGSLDRGAGLHRTGYNEENWYRVEYDGQTAYVSGDYVSVEE